LLGAASDTDGTSANRRRIPRIIHQVFLDGNLTPELRANVDELKARNPGWEHRLYDNERAEALIRDVYGEKMLEIFRKIDPRYVAARVDLLCNLIIHHAGGVYLDIKSTIERPLDEVVRDEDSYLLAQWRNGPGEPNEGWGLHRDLAHVPGGEYMKYFIIAEPGHPYSKAIIERIVENVKNYHPWSAVGRRGVLRTTGPIAYTLAIHPIRDLHPHRFTTEEELSSKPSIGGGYDHNAIFTRHYSTLTKPVVTLSTLATLFSRPFVILRKIKYAFVKQSADPRDPDIR
jgi:inositol phosphorylceramide mannosyltransferase catalytic subunit